jgi:hypothetical protein
MNPAGLLSTMSIQLSVTRLADPSETGLEERDLNKSKFNVMGVLTKDG